MKILVRLPNWLGDMVMSMGFIQALYQAYPESSISVIVKNGLEDLLDYFPPLHYRYLFSKEEYPGVRGALRFGRAIAQNEKYDLFFSLPDSFSAALMGFATGAKKRIGYKHDGRSFLLNFTTPRDKSQHRVEQYITLLEAFVGAKMEKQQIKLRGVQRSAGEPILVNLNSEAVSRRMPVEKAVSLMKELRLSTNAKVIMIGGKNDISFVDEVMGRIPDTANIEVMTGKTTIPSLVRQMSDASLLLTTDSGPAHLANACGLPTIVLFGAGNEKNTAPYNKDNCEVIRLGELACEPCEKNVCAIYGIPECLRLLDEKRIVKSVMSLASIR
ncbi:MAG: glycosyltransferase family 9 protein [Chitinophagaceae bacterium]